MSKFICHTEPNYLNFNKFQKGEKRKSTDSTDDQPETKKICIQIKGVTCSPNIRGGVTEAMAPFGKPKDIKIRKSKVAENELNIRFVMKSEEIADKIISAADSIQVLLLYIFLYYYTYVKKIYVLYIFKKEKKMYYTYFYLVIFN